MNHAAPGGCHNQMMVVYSPGGGNGKSEIAANLAYCLANYGTRTWLLDANIFAPTQDIIFNLDPTGPTFSEYLYDPAILDIPIYKMSKTLTCNTAASLYLTPLSRHNPNGRFQLKEQLNEGFSIYEDIPRDVRRRIQQESIESLIVDTYPSFEPINEVWLGMTDFLLIISRMNTIDIENLKDLILDGTIADIRNVLIVFNNVQRDQKCNVTHAMKNEEFEEKLDHLREEIAEVAAERDDEFITPGEVRVFDSPFLYSPELAKYRRQEKRNGLFAQANPDDAFSVSVKDLATFIQNTYFM